jgi:cytochrome P450
MIDGEFFPEGCEVGVAVYTMHHNTRYWDDAFSYVPERWLRPAGDQDKRKKAPEKKPYVPFSMGPRSCVGKPLAIAQMMLTLVVLLREFDFRRADEDETWETKDTVPTEYELKEHITSSREGPLLRFRPRL